MPSNHRHFNQMVPMRDKVKLSTDIYLPQTTKAYSWPAVLLRTPYDKTSDAMVEVGEYFASADYACVIQDVRGRHASEGEFEPFINEAEDGHDCLRWLGRQDWCDGRVGTMGTSYLAQTQASMATTGPPHLASQYISQGYGSYHRTRSRRGGAFENHRLNWILRMAATSKQAAEDPSLQASIRHMQNNLLDWLDEGYPIREGLTPLSRLPTYEKALINFMTHGILDEFWHNPGLNLNPHFDSYPDVPVTWLGSWYDGYALETPENFCQLARRAQSPQRLIMGPWVHGMSAEQKTWAGDIDFGPQAAFESLRERRRWFDCTLRGIENGVDEEPPVRIFVMGGGSGRKLSSGKMDHGGRWRCEAEWPLGRAVDSRYYLQSDGGLSVDHPPADAPPFTYDFDPADPVPSISAAGQTVFTSSGGGYDQMQDPTTGAGGTSLPLSARSDNLVFMTQPLERNTEVTGPIEVVLFVSSSAVDTDFTAKLIDQYPPNEDYPQGYALQLTYSIQRCRYRSGYDSELLMEPGRIYRLCFPLAPTGNLFCAGHRIRVDISSSNWPKYEVNPNTGEPVGRHRCRQRARNQVFCDARHPSHIVLPIIPGKNGAN